MQMAKFPDREMSYLLKATVRCYCKVRAQGVMALHD